MIDQAGRAHGDARRLLTGCDVLAVPEPEGHLAIQRPVDDEIGGGTVGELGVLRAEDQHADVHAAARVRPEVTREGDQGGPCREHVRQRVTLLDAFHELLELGELLLLVSTVAVAQTLKGAL